MNIKYELALGDDIGAAVEILITCWNNDYAHFIPKNYLRYDEKIKEIKEWINGKYNNDKRIILLAKLKNELIGFIGTSFAELYDSNNGIEINYGPSLFHVGS